MAVSDDMNSGESGNALGGIATAVATAVAIQRRLDAIDAYRAKWFAPENQTRSAYLLTYVDIVVALHSLPRYGMSASGHWALAPELTRHLGTRRYIRKRNRLRRQYARWLVRNGYDLLGATRAAHAWFATVRGWWSV